MKCLKQVLQNHNNMKWTKWEVACGVIGGNFAIAWFTFMALITAQSEMYLWTTLDVVLILMANRFLTWLNFKEIDESNPEDDG